jgi:hypothetical protein
VVSEKIKARVTVLELVSQYVDLKPTVNSTTWRFLHDHCHDEAALSEVEGFTAHGANDKGPVLSVGLRRPLPRSNLRPGLPYSLRKPWRFPSI